MSVAEVIVGLHQHILNVLRGHIAAPQKVVGLLDIPDILNSRLQYFAAHFGAEMVSHLQSLLKALVDGRSIGLGALVVPRLIVPFLPDLGEPPEIDRSSAHRTTCACALLVPGLYATRTEGMAAGQLAEGAAVVIANGALVSHLVFLVIPYYMLRLLGWGGREFRSLAPDS